MYLKRIWLTFINVKGFWSLSVIFILVINVNKK